MACNSNVTVRLSTFSRLDACSLTCSSAVSLELDIWVNRVDVTVISVAAKLLVSSVTFTRILATRAWLGSYGIKKEHAQWILSSHTQWDLWVCTHTVHIM